MTTPVECIAKIQKQTVWAQMQIAPSSIVRYPDMSSEVAMVGSYECDLVEVGLTTHYGDKIKLLDFSSGKLWLWKPRAVYVILQTCCLVLPRTEQRG